MTATGQKQSVGWPTEFRTDVEAKVEMAFVTITIFVLACTVGFAAWVTMVWNFVRIPFNLRKGLDPWGSGNPFNYAFQDDALNSVGLAARNRAMSSLVVFGSALVIGAIAGAITMWLS